ncbi:molecular chaperone HtpG [Lentisphaerota bacterium ZTH]|nr:molecular chaperone HtpG [Lentisphaerota bacterium]WET05529.1 molecular chaperone HtpG [Lentisphaerota bacterium ZTH]
MAGQTKKFKTEVQHLLDLMIHSLYSNKDIFIRELIANAADAIDKARFESLTTKHIAQDWAVRINVDKENKTIQISDNGIGMTRDEVVENIGTIAKSGTKAFIKAMEEQNASTADIPELIGQFGVGFYSSFMVAEKVVLTTKKAEKDSQAVCWTSTGKSSYTIEDAEKDTQGTDVIVYLKEDAVQYLENWKISEIVRKYSDFIEYPITLPYVKTNEDKTETVEIRTLNSQKAIWLKSPSEISEDEHKSFFAHLSHHGGEPLKAVQISAEGTTEFKALIYIPEKAPYNFFMPDFQKKGLQLYVRRVFITDECKDLIPDYLRFLCGVVDSSDLPLNVSREILQENPLLNKIQKNVTLKVLGELKKMQEKEPEKYLSFFKEFGKVLKEGIHLDFTNQEKIKDLAMYESMNTEPGKMISLKEYVDAMAPSQKEIYYISGESRKALENSPALEVFRSKGCDVLFMTDPIDEWVMQSMQQYAKKHFKSADKGDVELDDTEVSKEKIKKAGETHKNLLECLQKELAPEIKEVRFTNRLTDSACCLVADEGALSSHMERLFKAMNQEVPETQRILEINPNHPLVEALQGVYDQDSNAPELNKYAKLLFDQALLTEGSPIPDPLAFSRNVAELMVKAIKK